VIIIGPTEELASRREASCQLIKRCKSSRHPHGFMQVNYAKVADLAKLIKTPGQGSMLSTRGSFVDGRSAPTPSFVPRHERQAGRYRRLVQTLDVPVKQVLIWKRHVIGSATPERDLGVRLRRELRVGTDRGWQSLSRLWQPGHRANSDSRHRLAAPLVGNHARQSLSGQTPAANTNRQHRHFAARGAATLVDLGNSPPAQNQGKERDHLLAPRHHATRNRPPFRRAWKFLIRNRHRAAPRRRSSRRRSEAKVTPLITPDNRADSGSGHLLRRGRSAVTSAHRAASVSLQYHEIITQVLVMTGQDPSVWAAFWKPPRSKVRQQDTFPGRYPPFSVISSEHDGYQQ